MPTSEKTLASALAGRLVTYLDESPDHRALVKHPAPLKRDVPVHAATWLPWLRDGTRPGRRSSYRLAQSNSESAVDFLENDLVRGQTEPPVHIDRPSLEELAVTAARSTSAPSLIKLFVATMMWGSGTSNGRGPRRTAEALSDPALADTLLESQAAVLAGDIDGAHRRFGVAGVGEAFFTKWFWAASLAGQSTTRPLILDLRVRKCLWVLLGTHAHWQSPRGTAGYVEFIATVHAAAEALPNSLHPRVRRHVPTLVDLDDQPGQLALGLALGPAHGAFDIAAGAARVPPDEDLQPPRISAAALQMYSHWFDLPRS